MTGIPITAVLKDIAERDQKAERHKFFPPAKRRYGPASGAIFPLAKGEELQDMEREEALLRAIASDFREEAAQILESLNLSHLRRQGVR